jgi:hypothetical protein
MYTVCSLFLKNGKRRSGNLLKKPKYGIQILLKHFYLPCYNCLTKTKYVNVGPLINLPQSNTRFMIRNHQRITERQCKYCRCCMCDSGWETYSFSNSRLHINIRVGYSMPEKRSHTSARCFYSFRVWDSNGEVIGKEQRSQSQKW